MDPVNLTAIVNTGDDITLHNLKISPDLDIVTYTLAGIVDETKGWGYRRETFHALECLSTFGRINWFNLGDRDLATHIHRSAMLADGKSLTEVTKAICVALGVRALILPMSDQPVTTMIATNQGELHFQEYLVKCRAAPVVRGIRFDNVAKAYPTPDVVEAIKMADRIVICPSNPLISIGPILAVRGIREALRERKANVIAVCPIVGGKSLKGPSDKMLRQLGHRATALGVARLYSDFTGTFVIDPEDKRQAAMIQKLGMRVEVIPTIMTDRSQKRRLAQSLLSLKL